MNLITPEAQAGAYEWASVLLAHGFIGLVLVPLIAWLLPFFWHHRAPEVAAFWLAAVGYLFGWEFAVQNMGAGFDDAITDTVAVVAGALIGMAAWRRQAGAIAAAVVIMAGVLALGIWARRRHYHSAILT